jgi:hypothetical protein
MYGKKIMTPAINSIKTFSSSCLPIFAKKLFLENLPLKLAKDKNNLAYFMKRHWRLGPFFSELMNRPNKLDCMSLATLSCVS